MSSRSAVEYRAEKARSESTPPSIKLERTVPTLSKEFRRSTMETFARVETSEGRSAIAVVRVWGPRAIEAVDAVFRPARGKPLEHTPTGRLRLGRAGPGAGDEIVAVRLDSATPTVELQCHGGYEAVRALVSALEQAGARSCDVGTVRCSSSLVDDPIASQALADLPLVPTVRVAEILLDQAHGAPRLELAQIGRMLPMGIEPSLERLNRLIVRAALGLRLLAGWKVVISGRPNVGKSRLFNALAGYGRAIVDPTPGVTRDVVTIRTAFHGWPVELSDTAGLRETEDSIDVSASRGPGASRRELTSAPGPRSVPAAPRLGSRPHRIHLRRPVGRQQVGPAAGLGTG